MKSSLLLVAAIALFSAKVHAQEAPLKISQVPASVAKLTAFVPTGWKIEKQVNGDLNRDKVADAALVLVRSGKTKDANGYATARSRALVVALKNGRSWKRVGVNNSLLMGTRDGGAFWGMMETPVEVSIEKGILNVQQESGSRETSDSTHRFRYDARKRAFFLIGFEYKGNDRLTGGGRSVSSNFLTGASIITDYATGTSNPTTKKARVSTKLRTLESVSIEDRFGE